MNVVVVDYDCIFSLGGLCYVDELVCYKMFDVLGDFYIVGVLILGCYIGVCVGYVMINKLLWVFFDCLDVWEWVEVDVVIVVYLFGVGVKFEDLDCVV